MYDVESSKTAKLKAYDVESGKLSKLKKCYVADGGKLVKLWSGSGKYFYTKANTTGGTYTGGKYSEDGKTWNATLVDSAIAKSQMSCAYGLGKFWVGHPQSGEVYYSIDCVTWTLSKKITESTVKGIKRIYCGADGYIYVITNLSSTTTASNSDWIWKTNDGVNWTSALPAISANNGQQIADFKSGTVHGITGYFIAPANNNILYIPSSSSAYTAIYSSTIKSYQEQIGLSIKNSTLLVACRSSGSSNAYVAYTSKSSSGSLQIQKTTQIGSQYASISRIASTKNGLLIILDDNSTWLYDGSTATQKTNMPTISGYAEKTIFTGVWDGDKRVIMLGMQKQLPKMAYTDDFGSTWVVEEGVSSPEEAYNCGYVYACCYEGDYSGYYSE